MEEILKLNAEDPICWLAFADELEENNKLPQAEIVRSIIYKNDKRLKELLIENKPCIPSIINLLSFSLIYNNSPFYMSKYLVTQLQWEKIMGNNPSYFKGNNLPVERVSWHDCNEFCSKLSEKEGKLYRLPSEEEWEYCNIGIIEPLSEVAWYYENNENKTHEVGLKLANGFDLYDMLGNVWEGTSSLDGSDRVIRGGSWYDYGRICWPEFRYWHAPDNRDHNVGFRVLLEI